MYIFVYQSAGVAGILEGLGALKVSEDARFG